MAIADTACATHAYPLVDAVPVHPGWQEDDPVLHRVEQAVCSSDYSFHQIHDDRVPELLGGPSGRHQDSSAERGRLQARYGNRMGEKTENGGSCLEVLCDHVRGIRDTTRNLFLEFRY